jgi:ABC-type multidrug transport system fused ATPase/permease subunit
MSNELQQSKLIVQLIGDNEGLKKTVKESQRKIEAFGNKVRSSTGKGAAGFREMNREARQAQKAMGQMNNRVNNFSYQMQDVIVQAQAGASGFTILAQQGSQLAMSLGAHGALIGAILAFSGAIGGVLYRALTNTSAEAEKLREKLDDMIPNTPRGQMKDLNAMIKEATKQVEEYRQEFETLKAQSDNWKRVKESLAPDDKQNRQTFSELQTKSMEGRVKALEKIADAEDVLNVLKEKRKNLIGDVTGETETNKRLDKIREFVKTETEIENSRYADQQRDLDNALKGKAGKEEEYQTLQLKLKEKHLQKLADLDEKAIADTNKAFDLEKKQMLAAIAQIEKAGQSPEHREDARHDQALKVLEKFRESGLDVENKYNQLLEAERARHKNAMDSIDNANKAKKASEKEKARAPEIERQSAFMSDINKITSDLTSRENAEAQSYKRRHELLRQFIQKNPELHKQGLKLIEEEDARHRKAMSEAKIADLQQQGQHVSALMERYRSEAANSAEYFDNVMATSLDSFVSSFASAMANAIVYADDWRDALDNVAKAAIANVISGLIQMGIQVLVLKAISSSAKVAETAEAVAAGATIAAAYAPAAAAASLATSGMNAVPAAEGVATVFGLTYSLAGMAHDGIANIPSEGTWLLDKGERVFSADHNERLVKAMEGEGGRGTNVTNIFQISAGVAGTVRAEIEKTLPAIERMTRSSVENALRSGGQLSRAAGVR